VTTINGDKFRLSEHRGKYVLVHFWASWCIPCIKSMPMIKDLHAELSEKNKNFVLISLSSDWREQAMRGFIEKNSMTWPQAWINLREDVKRLYGVAGVPEYFLIDPDGKIIHSSHRFDEVKTAMSKSEE
jgi:thiol-disulfide isomerase/thioredoxin